jgi:hypothetical protein
MKGRRREEAMRLNELSHAIARHGGGFFPSPSLPFLWPFLVSLAREETAVDFFTHWSKILEDFGPLLFY